MPSPRLSSISNKSLDPIDSSLETSLILHLTRLYEGIANVESSRSAEKVNYERGNDFRNVLGATSRESSQDCEVVDRF